MIIYSYIHIIQYVYIYKLGPNGAGKSTMMSMLTGIETCDSGDGYINGSSIMWD